LDNALTEIGNPHEDPKAWQLANELNPEPVKAFSPGTT